MTIHWHRRKRISHSEYMAGFCESSKPDSVSAESKIAKAYERAASSPLVPSVCSCLRWLNFAKNCSRFRAFWHLWQC